jgi:hypothetical protein
MYIIEIARFWHFALLILLSISAGCGGGSMSSSTPTPPPPPPPVTAQVQIASTVAGPLKLAMSTSFQPAEWDYQFFTNNPAATSTLAGLLPQHIRLQGISQGVPQTSVTTWDFSILDAITQPVLGVADHSPEFQIAVAPAFMYDSQHNFLDPTYQQFADYAQNLVRYYDTGGFTSSDGVFHESPAYPSETITWFGIYNEPNFNNLDSTQYTQLYNAVVPALQEVDPSLNSRPWSWATIRAWRKLTCPLSRAE